jgi:hypothetical protein
MSIAYVNGANSGSLLNGAAATTGTFNAAAGNLLVAWIRWADASSSSISSVVDVAGSTWHVGTKSSLIGTNSFIQPAYAFNTPGSSVNTVAITLTGPNFSLLTVADQFSGFGTTDPFNQEVHTWTASGGTITASSFSTGAPNSLAYLALAAESASNSWGWSSSGGGATYSAAQATPGSNGVAGASFYNIYNTTQSSITPAFVQSSGAAGGLILYEFDLVTQTARLRTLMGVGQ